MAYFDSVVYFASNTDIKLFTLVDDFESGSVQDYELDVDSEVVTI